MKISYIFKTLFWSLPVGVTALDIVGYPAQVHGVSMQPLLNPSDDDTNDIIFIKKWNYKNYTLKRGDVISVTNPRDSNQLLVKRVIGLEGDLIKTYNRKFPYCQVPSGFCWVEGDNRSSTLDSNILGPIPMGLVRGKVTHILWPSYRFCKIDSEVPIKRVPLNLKKKLDKSFLAEIEGKIQRNFY